MSVLIMDIGFEEKETDNHLSKLFRIDALNFACLFGHRKCLRNSKTLLDAYKNDHSK